MPPAKLPNVNTVTLLGRIAGTRAESGTRGSMVFKPVCCVCGQEIRPWHLFWMPTPGEHRCIPCSEKDSCSEKEAPEEQKKSADDDR